MSDSGTNERYPLGLKLLHILCTTAGQNTDSNWVLPYCVCNINCQIMPQKKDISVLQS